MKFLIYRYNPETDAQPRMQEHVLAEIRPDMMLRDALIEIKARDAGYKGDATLIYESILPSCRVSLATYSPMFRITSHSGVIVVRMYFSPTKTEPFISNG